MAIISKEESAKRLADEKAALKKAEVQKKAREDSITAEKKFEARQ